MYLLEEIVSFCSDHLTPSLFQYYVIGEKNVRYTIVWKA